MSLRENMKTLSEDMAFPDGSIGPSCRGLTKREYFAAQIFSGLAANYAYCDADVKKEMKEKKLSLEILSIQCADCLIERLNEETK